MWRGNGCDVNLRIMSANGGYLAINRDNVCSNTSLTQVLN
ncbi:hypothetical protein yaldo0001_14820 [Yersinia aldovae ATCC 35236]|nr:hypothetical protein yaldo0001_14820 [Yersinia aldovae ATCC 35236]